MHFRAFCMALTGMAAIGLAAPASASLVSFESYFGNVALSTDGWGGLDGSGVISASAPADSTVVAAYLYTANQNSSTQPTTVTLDGNAVSYTQSGDLPNPPACCDLNTYRADVTDIVRSRVDGGAGGVYDFDIDEGGNNSIIDGSALVVVYENPALPVASVGLLDGFATVTGDSTAINFADPLDPASDDFFAEMILGISYSCCSQASVVEVNGQLLTENAGNFDDGENQANGSLITVGSFDDPISSGGASYADDRERYDLTDYITAGDTSIMVDTFNATQDDNIFLAGFYVSGEAGFNAPPPTDPTTPVPVVPLPAGGLLLLTALGAFAVRRRAAA